MHKHYQPVYDVGFHHPSEIIWRYMIRDKRAADGLAHVFSDHALKCQAVLNCRDFYQNLSKPDHK